MFGYLVICICVLAVVAKPTWRDLENYTFDDYVKDFDMKYSSGEIETRRQLFLTELARVRAHNKQNLSWKDGINQFSALTSAEKKGSFGRSKSHSAASKNLKHAKKLPDNFVIKPTSQLPNAVDWRTQGVHSAVKDQGYCGSCWAFASTATIESHVALQSGLLFDLSVQQIAMCAPNPESCGGTGGCQGSTAELAFDYASSSTGLFQEYQYSYGAYLGKNSDCTIPTTKPVAKISGFVQLPENNYTALMNAVASVGPIAISVDASWSGYESGVYTGCASNVDIDHAVVLMGYGTDDVTGQKYWLIRNSWSPTWGEKGYIRLARSDDDETNCSLDTTPQDGTACAGDNTPVKVCGTCGVLYDSSYPLNARLA